MTTPEVLLQRGISNESQEVEMTTVRLTPNATSNFQTRFQIPKQGHVLDSNSALVWTVSWDNYNSAEPLELVLLKNFSGGLNTIRRARFYIGGRELFTCEDVGHLIHVKNLSRNPDYQEEVLDMELGSVHGYFDTENGKVELGADTTTTTTNPGQVSGATGIKTQYNRFARALGSYSSTPSSNRGIEVSILLSDMFSALQSLQLPMDLEDMRLEVDWETDFDEVAWIAQDNAGSINDARKTISIQQPVLLLDYLTFPEEARAGLSQVLQSGIALPYIHTSISEKVLPEIPVSTPPTSTTTDIQLSLQGKLLMKMYVSHRLSNTGTGGVVLAPQIGNGRCRSQRGLDMSYNLYVNDLAIHDLPVDTDSQQYSFFSMAQQAMASVVPGQIAYNGDLIAAGTEAVVATQVNSAEYKPCGVFLPPAAVGVNDVTEFQLRDMVSGCQSYVGFDLSKYQEGSGSRGGRIIPADAGYRSGSSAVILRITQTGATNAETRFHPASAPKTVQVFTEEVKVLQIRGGIAEVLDA